jgi:hypothetical protein
MLNVQGSMLRQGGNPCGYVTGAEPPLSSAGILEDFIRKYFQFLIMLACSGLSLPFIMD